LQEKGNIAVGKTNISWCAYAFNIAWGCVKISDGCTHCYADGFDRRTGGSHWGPQAQRRTFGEKHWREPAKWNKQAERDGRKHRVFCSSMTDVFLDDPVIAHELEKLWTLIKQTPFLDWQLLTKRPERIRECLPPDWGDGWPNVWLGVSVENRKHGVPRIAILREIPAVVRFLSCEPLLEDLGKLDLTGIGWVIVGGESGARFRPMSHDWAKAIRRQCREHNVPFFFKQSAALYPGRGIELDGEVVQEFPLSLEVNY
jgi:protein gp37